MRRTADVMTLFLARENLGRHVFHADRTLGDARMEGARDLIGLPLLPPRRELPLFLLLRECCQQSVGQGGFDALRAALWRGWLWCGVVCGVGWCGVGMGMGWRC